MGKPWEQYLFIFAMVFAFLVSWIVDGSPDIEQWTMADFCEKKFYWACDLHPACSARSLHCFPNPNMYEINPRN